MLPTLFARMYIASHWRKINYSGGDTLSADILTNCTRSTDNSLSLWAITEPSEDELNRIALGIVSGFKRPDTIYLTTISLTQLEDAGLQVVASPENGTSALKGMSERHFDVVNLNAESLPSFAEVMRCSLSSEPTQTRIRWKKIKGMITDAVKDGSIAITDLKQELVEDLIKSGQIAQP